MGEEQSCRYERLDKEPCPHRYFKTSKDPETGEYKDYCIFHAPIEAKEGHIDKFWEEFEKDFKKTAEIYDSADDTEKRYVVELDCEGFVFPDTTDKLAARDYPFNISFARVVFSNLADFQNVRFLGDVKFLGVLFTQEANFSRCKFVRDASFDYAKFYGIADFEKAEFLWFTTFNFTTFHRSVKFYTTLFSGANLFWNTDFKGPVYFRGSKLAGNTDFKSARFNAETDFANVNFLGDVLYSSAAFLGPEVNFENASFYGNADFSKATFTKAPAFESTSFERPPNFRGAIFPDNFFLGRGITGSNVYLYCTFTDTESFWNAFEEYFKVLSNKLSNPDTHNELKNKLDCKGFVFPDSNERFKRIFPFPVDFSGAYFNGNPDFGDATLNKDADFSGAFANDGINFVETEFQSSADFRGLEVKEWADVRMNFTFFQQPTRVFIGDGDLSRWSFTGTNIEEVNFFRPKWPDRKGRGKRKKVYDEDLAEHSRGDVNYEEAGEVYRRLRLNYEGKLAYETAGDFHYGQLECRRRNKDKKGFFAWCDRRLIGAYKFFCGYGESIARPLFLLGFFFAAYTAAAMFIGFNTNSAEHVRWVLVPLNQMFAGGFWNWVAKFAYSIIFTIKSAVTFSLPPGNNEILVGLAYVWKFIAITLVTFLILALRRRFKR